MVNLRATASAVERSAPLNRKKKNAFCTVDSDIYRTRKAICCTHPCISVRSAERQLDWAVFLAGPSKADVLSCSESHKQQLLVRVALPAPRGVHPIAFLCSFWLGLQDSIYMHGRNTSVYIHRSRFCFSLARHCSQDLFILFGKFSSFFWFCFFFS
jgi:hypothetical protein